MVFDGALDSEQVAAFKQLLRDKVPIVRAGSGEFDSVKTGQATVSDNLKLGETEDRIELENLPDSTTVVLNEIAGFYYRKIQRTPDVDTTATTVLSDGQPRMGRYVAKVTGRDGAANRFIDEVSLVGGAFVTRNIVETGTPASRSYSRPVASTMDLAMGSDTYDIVVTAEGGVP